MNQGKKSQQPTKSLKDRVLGLGVWIMIAFGYAAIAGMFVESTPAVLAATGLVLIVGLLLLGIINAD